MSDTNFTPTAELAALGVRVMRRRLSPGTPDAGPSHHDASRRWWRNRWKVAPVEVQRGLVRYGRDQQRLDWSDYPTWDWPTKCEQVTLDSAPVRH